MKKVILLSIAAAFSVSAMAQRAYHSSNGKVYNNGVAKSNATFARTTALGSYDTLENLNLATDTLALYIVGPGADSGYCAGTDIYEDHAFGERYDFTSADSSLQVLGVISLFGGHVSPTSTNIATFKVWSMAAPSASPSLTTGLASSLWFNTGFPNTVLTSQAVPFTQLGIGSAVGVQDTPKITMFTTPTAYLYQSFFVGFDLTYTWAAITGGGDTIGLYSNKDGERTSARVGVVGPDTVINNVNVTQYSDASWHDNGTDNFQLNYNYFMFPIVKVGLGSLGVNSVKRNDFTFFGNYPNPAMNSTDIKFALAKSTNVTIEVMDMNGRVINTINQTNLSVGEHIVNVATANLAAGNYIYVIRTATGDGIASQLTVIK